MTPPENGSSPLARGTCALAAAGLSLDRLIPARAGNMSQGTGPSVQVTAHPRSRGEHVRDFGHYRPVGGSSPLARGTCLRTHNPQTERRLIPARAGNISRRAAIRCPIPAHPRSRGEHFAGFRNAFSKSGSSPLARGT